MGGVGGAHQNPGGARGQPGAQKPQRQHHATFHSPAGNTRTHTHTCTLTHTLTLTHTHTHSHTHTHTHSHTHSHTLTHTHTHTHTHSLTHSHTHKHAHTLTHTHTHTHTQTAGKALASHCLRCGFDSLVARWQRTRFSMLELWVRSQHGEQCKSTRPALLRLWVRHQLSCTVANPLTGKVVGSRPTKSIPLSAVGEAPGPGLQEYNRGCVGGDGNLGGTDGLQLEKRPAASPRVQPDADQPLQVGAGVCVCVCVCV